MIEHVYLTPNERYEEGERCLFLKGADRKPFPVTLAKVGHITEQGRRTGFFAKAIEASSNAEWIIAFFLDINPGGGAAGNQGETLQQLKDFLSFSSQPPLQERWRQEIGSCCC